MPSKKSIRSEVVVLCAAAFFLGPLNVAFWERLHAALAPLDNYERLFIAALGFGIFGLLFLFLSLFTLRFLLKPALTLFLLLSSAVAYFISEYGIVIDAEMIRNVMNTNTGEAFDLLTGKLFLYVICLGLLPAVILWVLPISYRPFWQNLWFYARADALMLVLIAAAMFPFVGTTMSFFRENRILVRVFSPLNYVSAVTTYSRGQMATHTRIIRPYGEDAQKSAAWSTHRRRTLTVLVIGETARAKNFSLNGYERETNPLLSKVPGLINYTNVRSCGTATAQSVPCIFSGKGRAGYQDAAGQEGLLHIIQRAGFSVLWLENQGGCAGVCKGVPTEIVSGPNRNLFELPDSLDENLLTGLDERIQAMQGDAVIVMHMMGSHGPAYYKRYPPAFRRFQPTCDESQFSRCERDQIVNAYDNTLLYTDYILAKLIERLSERDKAGVPTAMIYLSDHGESLGENNVYLHGLPYAFAPDVQKNVPMLIWLSPKYQADLHVSAPCLQNRRTEAVSHDNFFHSVLGLLQVKTKVYDAGLDFFAACRGGSAHDD